MQKQFADQMKTNVVWLASHAATAAQRRFTCLTNAFSKNFENLKAAVQLWVAASNFTRIHRALDVTPAMEAGVVSTLWGVKELLGVV